MTHSFTPASSLDMLSGHMLSLTRILMLMLATFACSPSSVSGDEATKRYGYGPAWLKFDYPPTFIMDPKSHQGESKWWARLAAPDGSLTIEVSSLGHCPESLSQKGGFRNPREYVIGMLVGEKGVETKHDGYARFVTKKDDLVTVVFLKNQAAWGRCFQELHFKFGKGTYDLHRESIEKMIESAVPSFASRRSVGS